jgi:hypothetical protein
VITICLVVLYTGVTDYVIGQLEYNDNFIASGSIGSKLYYRVKNVKDYITFCGNIINTVYSGNTINNTN